MDERRPLEAMPLGDSDEFRSLVLYRTQREALEAQTVFFLCFEPCFERLQRDLCSPQAAENSLSNLSFGERREHRPVDVRRLVMLGVRSELTGHVTYKPTQSRF